MCAHLFIVPTPINVRGKRPRSNVLPLTRPPRACADELSRKVKDSLFDAPRSPSSSPSDYTPPPLPVQRDLLTYHARVLARRAGTRAAAEALYLRVLKQDRSDGRAWLGIARLRSMEGRISAARSAFREGTRNSRHNPHLLQAWGVFEERAGNLARARALFSAAVRADPSHCASWVALGLWEKRHAHDNDRAAECFARGAEADPGNYYVWHVWGVLERERRNFAVARDCFAKGVAANPRNGATYVVWGALEDGLGRTEAAVALFEKAHLVAPRNAHAYVSHAAAVERCGQIAHARQLLEIARTLRPKDPAPVQALALHEFRAGNLDAARAQFAAGAELSRTHAPLWHAWACVEWSAGNLPRARELFQEAVWAAPKTAHVVRTWHAWASLELSDGCADVARTYLAHGLAVDRSSPALLALMAKVEAQEGHLLRARELLETALQESPYARFLWREYEQIERDAGYPDRAAVIFERSIVAAQLVDERLTVSPPLPGDFASSGMWIGADDLRFQDSATVRQTGAGVWDKGKVGERWRFGRRPDLQGRVRANGGDTSGATARVSPAGREKRELKEPGLDADAGGGKWRWTEKPKAEKSDFVNKRISADRDPWE